MDIRLQIDDAGVGDAVTTDRDLEADEGLETAVYLSLFLDRQARTDDEIPDGTTDRRGWWAAEDQEDHGSRLWLLERSKPTAETVNRAREYAAEALAWLVDEGIAARVDVDAERVAPTVVLVTVRIIRPEVRDLELRYRLVWQATVGGDRAAA